MKSFTLIEIVVVMGILSVILGIITVSTFSFIKSSRDAKRRADLENIRGALEQYKSKNDIYPYPASGNTGWTDLIGGRTNCYSGWLGGCWTDGSVANSLAKALQDFLPQLPQDPKLVYAGCAAASSSYVYCSLDSGKSYVLGTYLETSTTARTADCDGPGGADDCTYCCNGFANYKLGPYGVTYQ